MEDYIKEKLEFEILDEDQTFTMGQIYDDHPAKKVICAKCKGDSFYLGFGSFYAAAICTYCKLEGSV